MPQPVRGVLVIENQETGDGRVFAPGAFTWVDPPLPLAWLRDGDQHVDLTEVAPQIGTIDTISRTGDNIEWTGTVDDANPDGAEVMRRMDAGTAPLGDRFGLSIDWDNWEVEVIDTEITEAPADGGGALIIASGAGAPPMPGVLAAVVAAAGDPDPGDNGDGVVLFSESSGTILERHTAGRIRGATLCSVGAFDGAFMELAGAVTQAATPATEPIAASSPALLHGMEHWTAEPPLSWFDDITDEPDGSLNITADGQQFGYVAAWNTCHTGYTDRCVPPPREAGAYERFHTGAVVTAGNQEPVPCGVFTWNAPHADLSDSMIAAQDHYAHSACAFARVRVGANEHGIWHAGALMPGVTRNDLAALRALSMSGDWRYDRDAGCLRMVAALAVNYPGFPVARRQAVAASVPTLQVLAPQAHFDGDRIMALTSAGVLAPAGHQPCNCGSPDGDLAGLRADVGTLLRRTRHLIPDAALYAAGRSSG